MFKTILAMLWIFGAMTVLFLGLNGSIDHAAMVIFSLAALALFYGFALITAFGNSRDSKAAASISNELMKERRL
jgi:hypothetical protein